MPPRIPPAFLAPPTGVEVAHPENGGTPSEVLVDDGNCRFIPVDPDAMVEAGTGNGPSSSRARSRDPRIDREPDGWSECPEVQDHSKWPGTRLVRFVPAQEMRTPRCGSFTGSGAISASRTTRRSPPHAGGRASSRPCSCWTKRCFAGIATRIRGSGSSTRACTTSPTHSKRPVHRPWDAPTASGRYPVPAVDHRTERAVALARHRAARGARRGRSRGGSGGSCQGIAGLGHGYCFRKKHDTIETDWNRTHFYSFDTRKNATEHGASTRSAIWPVHFRLVAGCEVGPPEWARSGRGRPLAGPSPGPPSALSSDFCQGRSDTFNTPSAQGGNLPHAPVHQAPLHRADSLPAAVRVRQSTRGRLWMSSSEFRNA